MRRATRIRTTARGLDLRVEPTAPVVVITGPNGIGKSTMLNAIPHAIAGSLQQGGKTIAAPHLVYRVLMDGAGECRTRIEFGGDEFVDRSMIGADDGNGGIKVSTTLRSSWARGLTGKAAEGATIAALGNPALLDVQAFLALAPGDRSRRLIETCAALAPGWTADRLVGRMAQAVSIIAESEPTITLDRLARAVWRLPAEALLACDPDELFAVADGEAFYDALQRYTEAAAQRVRDNGTAIDGLKAAINRLDADAAERTAEVHGTTAEWEATCARLGREIEDQRAELAAVESAATRRASIDAEIDRLRLVAARPATDLAAEVQQAAAALQSAKDALAQAEREPMAAFEPSPEVAALRAELAAAKRTTEPLREQWNAATREVMTLQAIVDSGAGCCPTCSQAVDRDVVQARVDSLRAALADDGEIGGPFTRAVENEALIAADVDDIEREEANRKLATAREAGASAERRAALRLSVQTTLPRALAAAEQAATEHSMAADRLAALEAERAALPTGNVDELRVLLAGTTRQRDEAVAARRAVTAADERRATRLRAVADREEAEAAAPVLALARRAWAQVGRAWAAEAVQPFVATLNRVAPEGCRFEIDMGRGEIRFARPSRPAISLASLSDGEAASIFPAVAIALARSAGAQWAVVLADRCEAMQSDPAPGAPAGIFARFVEGLAAAAAAGEIDQAFVATSRMTPEEVAAIEALAGVQIIRLGTKTEAERVRDAVMQLGAGPARDLVARLGGQDAGSAAANRQWALACVGAMEPKVALDTLAAFAGATHPVAEVGGG